MGAVSDISRRARGLCGKDVLFLLSFAFVFFAFVITVIVIRR